MTTYYAHKEYIYTTGDAIFSIPFSYINKEHIGVSINGEGTSNYTYLNSSQIQILDTLEAGDVVSITRNTPIDNKMVVFSDTSILNKDVQNLAEDQLFNAIQEIYDKNIVFKNDLEDEIADNKAEVEQEIEDFEGEINQTISEVQEAAEKINALEEAVNTATTAATTATNKATEATNAANRAEAIIPSQTGNNGKFLQTNGSSTQWTTVDLSTKQDTLVSGINIKTINGESILGNGNIDSGSGYQPGDIVLKDHILSYAESLGLAQLGTYFYKEAIAGTRYGYPSYYQKLINEYQDLNNATETVDSVTVTINANGHKFYDIADKATFDNIFGITGECWYYGIDTTNERVFLPRSTRFKNGTTSDVGEYQAAGLPNITASPTGIWRRTNANMPTIAEGATTIVQDTTHDYIAGTGATAEAVWIANFNASHSSSIYGASNTVEYASTKLIPYMVVGNTANESGVIDVVDITTSENDTLPLGFSTYQGEGTQPSLAWLKSSGQWNSGEVYATFYNYYVPKIGDDFGAGKVVENTDPYTDYDLVINQTEQTFRLPLLDGSETLPGDANNRVTLSLGASGDTYTQPKNGYYELFVTSNLSYWSLENITTGIGSAATNAGNGYTSRLFVKANKDDIIKVVYQLSPTNYDFYFVPAVGNGSLYYKVANAVQNLELLDAGEVLEAVNDLIPNNSSVIAGYGVPDYANQITGTMPSFGNWVQVTKDSYVCLWGGDSYTENYDVLVSPDNGSTKYHVGRRYDDTNGQTQETSFYFIVPKNWYFISTAEGGSSYRIYPLKGAN